MREERAQELKTTAKREGVELPSELKVSYLRHDGGRVKSSVDARCAGSS